MNTSKYEGLEVNLGFQSKAIIELYWRCPGIGFGILTLNAKTLAIIDDEHMSNEFCQAVIKKWKESE